MKQLKRDYKITDGHVETILLVYTNSLNETEDWKQAYCITRHFLKSSPCETDQNRSSRIFPKSLLLEESLFGSFSKPVIFFY